MEQNNSLSPICLFTYNRLEETKKTIAALQQNFLASESELFIFSDGWKSEEGRKIIEEVRVFLKTIKGFKKITIFESPINKGLANSIISGVTKIIEEHGKIIVLEDDLITSPNFLDFMNQALDFYENNERIFSISGFSLNLPSLKDEKNDYYVGYRASSWGWGTWKKEWKGVDWQVKDYINFIQSKELKKKFKRGGSDLPRMLKNQMNGTIDSWAIRWCYQEFKNDQFTLFPIKSKVESIGFGSLATHTKKTTRFNTNLDRTNQRRFLFDNNIEINKILIRENKRKFSLWSRVLDRF